MYKMTALANTLEQLAMDAIINEKVLNDEYLDEYEYLLDLANDVYIASLETHVASLESFGYTH